MTEARKTQVLFWVGCTLTAAAQLADSAPASWKSRFPLTLTQAVLTTIGGALLVTWYTRERLESKQAKQREADFLDRLKAVADDLTMEDPALLDDLRYEYDEKERQEVLERLERLPKGRRALGVVMNRME